MTTPLHIALGRSSGDITMELVRQACEQRVLENEQLDWKSTLPLPANATAESRRVLMLELAKDIAAMANTRGGLLVYGVRDEGDAAIEVVGVDAAADPVRRIGQVAYNQIYPPVQLRAHHLVDSEAHVLVLEVPESDQAPHLVQPRGDGGTAGWLMAPYRSGSHTMIMVEKQLEAAYRQRFDGRRQRLSTIRDLHAELPARHIPPRDQAAGALVAVAVPVLTRRGPLPGSLPSHTAQAAIGAGVGRATRVANAIQSPSFPAVLLGEVASPRRGLRRHTFTQTRRLKAADGALLGHPARVAAEIHDDATIALMWQRGAAFGFTRTTSEPPPVPSLGVSDPDAFGILLVSLLECAGETLEHHSDYQLRVGWHPAEALHLIPEDGRWDFEESASVPAPPPLEADLRLVAEPETRTLDIFGLCQDLNNMVERSRTSLERFWEAPRGASAATWEDMRRVAEEFFGDRTHHPVSGEPM